MAHLLVVTCHKESYKKQVVHQKISNKQVPFCAQKLKKEDCNANTLRLPGAMFAHFCLSTSVLISAQILQQIHWLKIHTVGWKEMTRTAA